MIRGAPAKKLRNMLRICISMLKSTTGELVKRSGWYFNAELNKCMPLQGSCMFVLALLVFKQTVRKAFICC